MTQTWEYTSKQIMIHSLTQKYQSFVWFNLGQVPPTFILLNYWLHESAPWSPNTSRCTGL